MDISRWYNKVIPFGQYLARYNLLLESAFKIEVERSFYVVSFLIDVYIHFESRRSCGILCPTDRILHREQGFSTPAAGDLREEPVFNRVMLGTIRRIMHYRYILSYFVCKVHKVLFYNTVRAGIRSSSIAKYNDSPRIRVFVNQMCIPYVFNVVTNEFGRIVALSNGHITNISLCIIDAVRNDFTLGKVGKVMIKGLGSSNTHYRSLTLEVTDEFFLLGVYADDWDSGFNTLLPCFGNDLKLFIPVLHLYGSEAFDPDNADCLLAQTAYCLKSLRGVRGVYAYTRYPHPKHGNLHQFTINKGVFAALSNCCGFEGK